MATYNIAEDSFYNGKPVELYRFARKDKVWLYTSSDNVVQYNSEIYKPIPLTRGEIDQSQEIRSGGVDITVPRDNDLACSFLASTPNEYTWLTIFRFHRGNIGDTEVTFIGRVANVEFQNSQAIIKCNPIYDAVARNLMRIHYQAVCNHVIYDDDCTINRESYRVTTAVNLIDSTTLQSPDFASHADGWFTGGYLRRDTDYRMIIKHVGDTIKILVPIPSFSAGTTVDVYAGCDRTECTCLNKFNNLVNFIGWTHIPALNPFQSNTFR